jgi:hypothetical protein
LLISTVCDDGPDPGATTKARDAGVTTITAFGLTMSVTATVFGDPSAPGALTDTFA